MVEGDEAQEEVISNLNAADSELLPGVYTKVSNFFELEYKSGMAYEIPQTGQRMSDDSTVFVEGKLYSSKPKTGSSLVKSPSTEITKALISKQFGLKLRSSGYFSRMRRLGDYFAYSSADEVQHPQTDLFRLYSGFEYRLPIIQGRILLILNPHLIFQATASIAKLITLGCPVDSLRDFSVAWRAESGVDGYLVETVAKGSGDEAEICSITDYRDGAEYSIKAERVFPESRPDVFQHLLGLLKRKFDVNELQRRYSFLEGKTSAKDRFSRTMTIAKQLRDSVFPVSFDDYEVHLSDAPVAIRL